MAEPRFRLRVSQAAKLAGVHKTTVLRAISSGKLTATKDARGVRRIDAAELERVYGPLRAPDAPGASAGAPHQSAPDARDARVRDLEVEVERLRDELREERAERRQLVDALIRLRLEYRPAPTSSTSTPSTPETPVEMPGPRPDRMPAPGAETPVERNLGVQRADSRASRQRGLLWRASRALDRLMGLDSP